MPRARLMDTPEDHARLGVEPGRIEVWEDRRRDDSRRGGWEWWYVDAILDDGTTVVVQLFPKRVASALLAHDRPTVWIKVTTPDGAVRDRKVSYRADQYRYGGGRCDVRMGPHTMVGDLAEYDVHIEPIDGVGCDLHLSTRSKPFRPGSGYIGFGDRDEQYFTWLCVMPRGEVTGSLTIDGCVREVRGRCYHDHQWGNANFQFLWNNWTCARQAFEDHTILLFDLVAAEKYGYRRFPICFIQDAGGHLLFRSGDDVSYEVLEEGVDPSCTRFAGEAEMRLERGGETVERGGELIFEFMCPGKTYRPGESGR